MSRRYRHARVDTLKGLLVSAFDFTLPPELIAQTPAVRGTSRLLTLDRVSGTFRDHSFTDLPALLEPGDLLVVNDTRVFPARLLGRRLPGGGATECFLVRRLSADADPDAAAPVVLAAGSDPHIPGAEIWEALVHPGQRLAPGARLEFARGGRTIQAVVLSRRFNGRRAVQLWSPEGSLTTAVDTVGHVPLPPYIKRPDDDEDEARYQTVFAHTRGAIAAPTAGLHFTPATFAALDARGVERATITLHVGYGTFQPVRVETVDAHTVDAEAFSVSPAAAAALTRAHRDGRRIIAVGTTTTRALESLRVAADGGVDAETGWTPLFIAPGHEFRLVSGLITNFHLPKSSLLMLVSAFAGRERVLAAYEHAVAAGYRFYSYGDAMLIR